MPFRRFIPAAASIAAHTAAAFALLAIVRGPGHGALSIGGAVAATGNVVISWLPPEAAPEPAASAEVQAPPPEAENVESAPTEPEVHAEVQTEPVPTAEPEADEFGEEVPSAAPALPLVSRVEDGPDAQPGTIEPLAASGRAETPRVRDRLSEMQASFRRTRSAIAMGWERVLRSAGSAARAETPAQGPATGAVGGDSGVSISLTGPMPAPGNPPPEYPDRARRARQAGTVLVHVVVESDGRVSEVRPTRSSGFELLDAAALEAVKMWRFTPAREGERAIRSEADVPVVFVLRP